jgi:hypothetical protein
MTHSESRKPLSARRSAGRASIHDPIKQFRFFPDVPATKSSTPLYLMRQFTQSGNKGLGSTFLAAGPRDRRLAMILSMVSGGGARSFTLSARLKKFVAPA